MNYIKKHLSKTLVFVLLFFVGIAIPSCEDGSLNPLDFNAFSVQDDVTLGQQLDEEIRANPSQYPILNSVEATRYVQDIANEIISSPQVKYRGTFPYKVQIINDAKTINAFAAPGGYIYDYTGLLKFLDNEATLAAVISHEIAHAERRHSTKRMTKIYGVQIVLDVVLGKNPSQLEQIGANLLTGLGLLKNSRDDEYEADEYSFKYLQSTKWYPGATIFFFDKVKENQSGGLLEELLSTHPMPEDRIKAVEDLIKAADLPAPSESNLFAKRYSQFKDTLP